MLGDSNDSACENPLDDAGSTDEEVCGTGTVGERAMGVNSTGEYRHFTDAAAAEGVNAEV